MRTTVGPVLSLKSPKSRSPASYLSADQVADGRRFKERLIRQKAANQAASLSCRRQLDRLVAPPPPTTSAPAAS